MISVPLLVSISVVAGFVGSMTGMGGGVVLIPLLTFLGLDIKRAIAVSMVSVIATSSGSAFAYVKGHLTNLKVGMFLEIFTMTGATLGALVTVSLNPRLLYILFAFVLFLSWGALLFRSHRPVKAAKHLDRMTRWLELDGSYFDEATGAVVRYQPARAPLGGVFMIGAGFFAGLLGIGAGALKVLIHDLVMELPPKVSTTTSNLIIGVTALSGAGVYLSRGLVEPGLAAPVVVGVVIGAFSGTKILVHLKNETVRKMFLVVLAVLGIEMLVRGIRGV